MERYSLWGVVWDLCKGAMIIFKYSLGPLIDQTMDSHESFFIFIATTIASHHDDSWQKGVVTHFQRCSAYMWTCTYADLHACRYANLVTFYLLAQSHFFFLLPMLTEMCQLVFLGWRPGNHVRCPVMWRTDSVSSESSHSPHTFSKYSHRKLAKDDKLPTGNCLSDSTSFYP